MTALALAYLAGLITTLSPCVLPLLPLVLAGTLAGHGRLGPIAFALGMVLSFTLVGLFIATIGLTFGISSSLLRQLAAAAFVVMGIVLIVGPLQDRMSTATAGLATRAGQISGSINPEGLAGPFLIGSLAGAVWSPCSGPSLGAAIALATEAGGLVPAATRMLFFGLGATTVLMLLAYGSRSTIMSRRNALIAASSWLKPAAGIVFVLVGVSVIAGWDKWIEARLLDVFPAWLNDLLTRY